MKINVSKATFSSIVGIGQKVKKTSKETGNTYLELNRGVNSVVGIDLTEVSKQIDFNSKELQLYAPNLGIDSLRQSIAKEYFPNSVNMEQYISILPGGMPGLDLIIQTLNVDNIYFPQFYWGSYSKMATIRNKPFSFYNTLDYFDLSKLNETSCVFICDPNNPTGMKLDDDYLLKKIHDIANTGAIVIFDSPYRKLFFNDNFFEKVLHPNVIICESFSKWIGLPGARTGFIHSTNKEFNEELNIRLLYEFNGVSSPSQILVNTVLSTPEGKKAINDFQVETRKHIKMNIDYLRQNNLLVDEIYKGEDPLGIFAIINKSEDFLFQNRIGAVGLDKFVYYEKDTWSSYSRICVSVQHELFKQFMSTVV
jgi:aspartate/methionine/tyrosine aminotransferase